MALPLHEKDMNAMGAGALFERRLLGKPASQDVISYGEQLKSASGCITAGSPFGAASHMPMGIKPSSNSPAPPPAGPTGAHLQSVEEMLKHLKQHKLTESRPIKTQPHRSSTPADNVCLVGENSGRIKWIQPSGPRRNGEGTEDEEQGIIAAESTPTGGALMRITLLAAGFVIGPSGACVREISKQTGADIKSWTQKPDGKGLSSRPTRSFVIEGKKRAVVLALDIMCDAVDRYKELCEGRFCGHFVARIQKVRGVEFSYQPPPRNIVPYAAALKGQHPRYSRAEAPPAALPASQLSAPTETCTNEGSSSVTSPLSPQGTESCSDMADDHNSALLDNKRTVHSKAQVMQSYLNAQGLARPHVDLTPHSRSVITNIFGSQDSTLPDSPSVTDMTAAEAAPKQFPSRGIRYTTPHPGQGEQAGQRVQPPFARGATPGMSPLGMTAKEQTGTASMAATAQSQLNLVRVKPNVWLPLGAVQQAGGDLDLALHLAAQGILSTDAQIENSIPSPHNGWGAEAPFRSYDSSFLFKSSAGERSSDSYQHETDNKYAPQTCVSDSSKAYSVGSHWSGEPPIQPPPYHMKARSGQAAASNSITPNHNPSGFNFKSPTASLPFMSSSNTYISPQCVLDNNSLFSYNVATPEQADFSKTAPWYATPETSAPPPWGPATISPGFSAAAYYPELNPSAAKHMSGAYGIGPAGQSALPHTPFADGPYWQDSVTRQLLPEYGDWPSQNMPQSNMAASMGSHNTSAPQTGTSTLPWIQGSHPLMGGF